MKDSTLILLLKELEATEIKRFKDFLKSPFFNTHKVLVPFYEAVILYYPEFEGEKFTKQNIYRKTFGRKPYNEKTTTNLMYELKKMLETFFIYAEIELDEEVKMSLDRKAHIRRNNETGFIKSAAMMQEKITAKRIHDPSDYLKMMGVHDDLYANLLGGLKKEAAREYLIASMENLDKFYFIKKMELSVRLYNRTATYGYAYEIVLLEEIMELGGNIFNTENPIFDIYCLIIQLYRNPDYTLFKKTVDTFIEHHGDIRFVHQVQVLVMLMNFTGQQIGMGKMKYEFDLFKLIQFRVEKNLLLAGDSVTSVGFVNTIILAAKFKEFDWARWFEKEHIFYIKEEEREDILNFCEAFVCFFKKDYHSTIRYLNQTCSRSFLFEMRHRSLWIRSHFELWLQDEEDLVTIIKYLDSFKDYLKRKTGKDDVKVGTIKGHTNFCSICELLVSQAPKAQIIQKLNNADQIVYKAWLFEKIEMHKF